MQEISSEMGISAADISSKFHALRSQFNRECNKEKKQKSGSGSEDLYVSRWEFMSSMRFLKASSDPGVTISNLVV